MAVSEAELKNALLLAAPVTIPNLRLFRRHIMKATIGNRFMSSGVKGQSDLYGYLKGGRIIELELKAYKGYVFPEQEKWATFCKEWDVLYLLLKAKKDELCGETVQRWISEIRSLIKPYNQS